MIGITFDVNQLEMVAKLINSNTNLNLWREDWNKTDVFDNYFQIKIRQ